jgi:hypothetical protein
LRSLVVTGGLHKKETEIRPILMIHNHLSREECYFAWQNTNFTILTGLQKNTINLFCSFADLSSETRLDDRPGTTNPSRNR